MTYYGKRNEPDKPQSGLVRLALHSRDLSRMVLTIQGLSTSPTSHHTERYSRPVRASYRMSYRRREVSATSFPFRRRRLPTSGPPPIRRPVHNSRFQRHKCVFNGRSGPPEGSCLVPVRQAGLDHTIFNEDGYGGPFPWRAVGIRDRGEELYHSRGDAEDAGERTSRPRSDL